MRNRLSNYGSLQQVSEYTWPCFSNVVTYLKITALIGLHIMVTAYPCLPAGRWSPKRDIANVMEELGGSGSNIGYQKMHIYLQVKWMICRRKYVRVTVKVLDPEGVPLRRRRRLHWRKYIYEIPNYMKHIYGHDKHDREE